MYKQDNDFANYDGLRMSLISRLRKQVFAVPAPLLCGLLFAAVLALLPISAGAQCSTGWDMNGTLTIIQRGAGQPIYLELQQRGNVITGRASYVAKTPRFLTDDSRPVSGTVDGTLDGDSLSIQIFWPDDLTGVYNGKILPSGRVDGETYDKNNTKIRQPWRSEGVLKCAPPPVIPKVIKSSGKAKSKTPPPQPPFINASQAIAPTSTHPFGIVVLGWDGGPDHPNVEVWLSMDNGTEIPAFSTEHAPQSPVWKQPKASIQLHLQRYHHYKFVLKAGGKTLSTAVVVVP